MELTVGAYAFLVLFFPAAGAAMLAGRGWRWSRGMTRLVGPGVVWVAFAAVLLLLFNQLQQDSSIDTTYWTWVRSGGFVVPFDLVVDRLSVFMCLVITGVGALIVTYATGYMEHERDTSYARFFCYMDLFIFSMLLLVLAGNTVFLIIGWAMVGLSSYLLIGFYYWRDSAVLAARKAFVMNVIGDVGLILGAFVLFVGYHQVTYGKLFAALPKADSSTLELAGFLLLVGAVAKSAQLPLHTWLPDAMEGPTPVSALIHAATMVTAGVYLVGRFHLLYDVAVDAHAAVAIVGAVTALFAATIAIVQTDIKRVLAYSTMSQIGYMFLAVGVGAYSAGFFHLVSHAFFKALLFLAAGNVIHSMNDEQDMRLYGGLWRQLRTTSVCFLVGALSLAGIFPLVGFFSKEAVLGAAFSRPGGGLSLAVWAIGFLTAVITGFYTGRMWYMSFWGAPSHRRPVESPHEAPRVMLYPVVLLAVLTVVAGALEATALFPGAPRAVSGFLASSVGEQGWEGGPSEYAVTVLTLILGAVAFAAAFNFYVRPRWKPWSRRMPGIQRLLEQRYHFDAIYDRLFVRPLDGSAVAGGRFIEDPLIGGVGVGLGEAARSASGGLSATQTGYFRTYALVFGGGAVVAAAVVLLAAAGVR